MKIPQLFKHNKLWAATARRSSAASAGMDFEEMPEPNMKLSRALLIVLLLHVVAVSGIIAFNAIKSRERSFVPAAPATTGSKPAGTEAANQTDAPKPRATVAQKESTSREEAKPSHSPPKLPSKDEHPKASSSAKAAKGKPAFSGKSYTVKKGDNPVTIAKKLKVSYDDLIALNHIEDPRKLRVGQKLLIPKATKPRTTNAKATSSKEKKNETRRAKQRRDST
jgi:nucleoid-associated protein YgaU